MLVCGEEDYEMLYQCVCVQGGGRGLPWFNVLMMVVAN